MTDCATRLEELTHEVDIVLDEDLAALQRMPDRSRVDRYNTLKAKEEEFLWDFSEECPGFLTDAERARVRGNFRLARLLVAASFYGGDGTVPRAMADDFVEAELQAVVDFDRYKQFDALSESQIKQKIQRMEGEVYELVEEYTSTQIANIEELLEHPDVQQDLMERLLERYEERREKIRQGFFIYVESYGLEHTVEAIEEAVEEVNTASEERKEIRQELEAQLDSFAEQFERDLVSERRQIESEIDRLESQLASGHGDIDAIDKKIESLEEEINEVSQTQEAAVSEMNATIEQTTTLEERIETKIEQLQKTREQAMDEAASRAGEEAATLVENELEQLTEQRDQIRTEIERLEREREQIEATRESLDEKQESLESQVSEIEQSIDVDDGGIEGENVVTTRMAKLMEMDYLGRFDISMHQASAIHTGEEEFRVPEGYWKDRGQRLSNRAYLLDILGDDADSVNQYPTNAVARYEITSSRYLGLASQTEMVIEARVVSNLHAHATNGFDTQPAGMDALLEIVNEVVAEAEDGEYTTLLGLASPTGWSDQVRDEIVNDDLAKTRYSQYVSVCLINLQNGSLIYDESDPVARENVNLFAPRIDEERIQECTDLIRSEYVRDVGQDTVLLRDLVADHEYKPKIIKRAFNRLEKRGDGEQLYLDDLGLGLDTGPRLS